RKEGMRGMHTADLVGIDCTGRTTVAVLRRGDGQVDPLQFDRSAELPSGVYLDPGGRILTGRGALDAATADPTRYIATPMRLLEAAPDPARDDLDPTLVVAALLGRVREQASRAAETPVARAVLLTPPGWGPRRRTRLRTAAHNAGLTD